MRNQGLWRTKRSDMKAPAEPAGVFFFVDDGSITAYFSALRR
jgi:hypothetical protein